MSAIRERVAAAPITWGVCEVPGWGFQLPPDRVLDEIQASGVRAMELGPAGFLPEDPAEVREALGRRGLSLVGAFLPAVLHLPQALAAELGRVREAARALAAAGGSVLVLAASTGEDGYEDGSGLTPDEWNALIDGIERARAVAEAQGVNATLHPHVGTAIEGPDDVDALLERSDVPLCLDTGHLLAGGIDPKVLVARAARRIAHVHLKDVSSSLAEQVRTRELGYREAVEAGLYRPLGGGDVDVAAVVCGLEAAGYGGWYVIEQDTVLHGEPEEGGGPVRQMEASLRFLQALEEQP